jgi:hypothetical protein
MGFVTINGELVHTSIFNNCQMITFVHEHSVDLDLLRKPANILDLGCRGFEFTTYFDQRGDYVIPVDMDYLKTERPYLRFAVTNYNGTANIKRTSDPQATSIGKIIGGEQVEAITLQKLLQVTEVPFYDLIKMDIESAEYEVIMSLEEPPARQLSIEFHLHTGVYGMPHVRLMEAKLKMLGYKPVSHELTEAHGAGKNYWDSLFILQ